MVCVSANDDDAVENSKRFCSSDGGDHNISFAENDDESMRIATAELLLYGDDDRPVLFGSTYFVEQP